jgi:hypothetical protein
MKKQKHWIEIDGSAYLLQRSSEDDGYILYTKQELAAEDYPINRS